jgi:UDP-N-acetyl-D-glucosamine/UDP-N-acetyl-D-galactosamine dehydrogenase
MNKKITIIGLGYVGLPLAIEFSKYFKVIGFDINISRINELKDGFDSTNEISKLELSNSKENLTLTDNLDLINDSNFYIITVPTPINSFKQPNLNPLINATKSVAEYVNKGDFIIYESTVFPGCTEEICVPLIEGISGLKFNIDFYCGYSPERINPGDKINTLTKIIKITSGSNPKASLIVDDLYKKIIKAGTYLAPTIKVAEAAKAIENAQRDLNISFVNELALIFDKMDIDTHDVLDAAGTKWNFLKFKPGLVGGHCISVDPYYLTSKAESLGYYPEVILSGRRINDNMPKFISNKAIKLMSNNGIVLKDSRALILGITFKENCPDIRNTKVIEVFNELNDYGLKTEIYDPFASKVEVKKEFNLDLIPELNKKYNLIILAVAHDEFKNINIENLKINKNSIVFDLKAFLNRKTVNNRL